MLALDFETAEPGSELRAHSMRYSVLFGVVCFPSDMTWGGGQNISARLE